MQFKYLGNTGLQVSTLSLGTMTFGDGASEADCQAMYAHCRDKGINSFDCANVYADGESERILGRLVRGHRKEVILSTKAFYPTDSDVNARGLSRFHLTKAVNSSLDRLGTDYIDIFYLHHFDDRTPLVESLSTVNDFVRQGKVLYLGLSNFSAWQTMKAVSIAREYNFESISVIQPMYNLLKRQCESEILPMALSENLAVMPYSPIAGGLLSGKYLRKSAGSGRFSTSAMYQARYQAELDGQAIKRFCRFAQENSFDPVSLAIAWVGAHPAVTSPLIGGRTVEQLRPALRALDLSISDELRSTIAEFSYTPPAPDNRDEEMT